MKTWVRVEDRLPETYDTVLFYLEMTDDVCVGYMQDDESWIDSAGLSDTDLEAPIRIDDLVTHWMPMPEGPDDGTDDVWIDLFSIEE